MEYFKIILFIMSFSKRQNYCRHSKTMQEMTNLYLDNIYFYNLPNKVSFKTCC